MPIPLASALRYYQRPTPAHRSHEENFEVLKPKEVEMNSSPAAKPPSTGLSIEEKLYIGPETLSSNGQAFGIMLAGKTWALPAGYITD